MARVKICGIRTVEMAEQVAKLPVDYIGFVFAKSKRQVSPAEAGAMIQAVRAANAERPPLAVGVFVNPSLTELESILREAPLDIIQLHGQEDPAFCLDVKNTFPGVQVYKVFSVTDAAAASSGEEHIERIGPEDKAGPSRLEPFRAAVDGFLLDTFDPLYGGGSGKTFGWEAIPPYAQWCREAGIPLLIAGGLHPENVGSLVSEFSPDGVDVSSGVETDGVKDIHKITTFVERVKSIV